jgi:nitrate reductase delta subunit
MRAYMRDVTLGRPRQEDLPAAVGMTGAAMEQMYRLLAIAKYADRYVIPTAHREQAHLWRRHRGTSPSLTPLELRTSWQAISWLLDYPTVAHRLRAPGVRAAIADLPAPVREPLGDVLEAIESQPLARLQSDYVDTFDVTRRCALHLTYYTCGDTRKRGVELVRFKQAYRDAGAAYDHEELPDHLGVVLEFGATVNHAVAWKLLCDHRVGVELLARALTDRDSTVGAGPTRAARNPARARRHRRGSPRPAHCRRPAQRAGRPRTPGLRPRPPPPVHAPRIEHPS